MSKFQMAITYEPKIESFLSGECRQTIRRGRKISVGDRILFHGWAGRPYWTPWSWRKMILVENVENIIVFYHLGIQFSGSDEIKKWQNLDILAAKDGIRPATGFELRRVLFPNLKKIPKNGEKMQIIRW